LDGFEKGWMNLIIKLRNIALAGLVFVALITTGMMPSFADAKWYDADIQDANRWLIVPESMQQESYDGFITRGDFAEILVRAYLSSGGNFDDLNYKSYFEDTNTIYPDLVYYLQMVTGYPDGTFKPDGKIKREEMFVMIDRFTQLISRQEPQEVTEASLLATKAYLETRIIDSKSLNDWSVPAVERLLKQGIISGGGTGLISPKISTTRAQALIMVKKAIELYRYSPISSRQMSYRLNEVAYLEVYNDPSRYFTSRGSYSRGNWNRFNDENNDGSTRNYRPRSLEEIYTPEQLLVMLGNNSVKYALVFGSADAQRYQTAEEAQKHMVSIAVDVWILNSNGTKSKGIKYLTVNESIAGIVKEVFQDIFDGPEKFPIKNVGGYSWRVSETSEHRWGLAIDINSNENYMIKPDGTVVAGSYWKPGLDPYSIKPDGDVVRAFKAHGFTWGGDAWSSSNDYMHFSFLGW